MADELFAGLDGFAEALEKAPSAALESARIAINEAAIFAEQEARARVHANLNLKADYVRRNLFLHSKATTGSIVARIRAKQRAVLATRYGAQQRTEPTRTAAGRLKGDPVRKIPAGRKAAGSNAWSVLRGSTKVAWRNAFFVYLRTSGAWAMVARSGPMGSLSVEQDWDRNLEVINSTSVAQAWRGERDDIGREAMSIANRRFTAELEKRL